MKRTLQRSWLILIIVIAFLIGEGFLVVSTLMNSPKWVDQPYNGHVAGSAGLAKAGKIVDRNGSVLAKTEDGERKYNEDKATRKALLHVVGDDSLSISTAIQSQLRTDQQSYSFLWGINLPQSFRKSGGDIKLTVDSETCKTAYKAFRKLRKNGAIVIYNYKTGEVICDVSLPTYDPENPPEINKDNEKKYEGVYLDNVVSSTYIPGSVFKIVTAVAAIENDPDIWNKTWYCEGETRVKDEDGDYLGKDDDTINCVEAHYEKGLKEAFRESCNYVFAQIAYDLGEEVMTKTANNLGINSTFSVSGIPTAKGNYDLKDASGFARAWSGSGQYTDMVNPMQMAILCGAIANDGVPVNPYLVETGSGSVLEDLGITGDKGTKGKRMMSSSAAQSVSDLMRDAVENYYGEFDELTVCAKTGTGEIESGSKKKNNGWMVGFSTDSDCPLAFACVVSNTDKYGSETAGEVARAAMAQAAKSLRKNSNSD